ncbi:biotin-dependent carboxyltransferase family protein [Desulfobacterales bacterium HSG16]|nr:biotin-dependent carboxyltransferase family protein [Desulfobacterales bacterium HSG16]
MQIFRVLEPGAYTTVQDSGRYGYQQFGVPPTGALDSFAYQAANVLTGNCEDAAVLEMTFLGTRLEVLADAEISITGSPVQILINDQPADNWSSLKVRPGDIIKTGMAEIGCRAYLAVTGGIDVPLVMGSRSCYSGAKIGGHEGRPLVKGDILLRGKKDPCSRFRRLQEKFIPEYSSEIVLRAIPGPQDDFFDDQAMSVFFESEFTVTPQANRMGYRLDGPGIFPCENMPKSIISEPNLKGSVQIPEDGQPIILLGEQTVGGYTKIVTVISADISKVAQAVPGDKIRFEKVSLETAHELLREQAELIRQIKEEMLSGKKTVSSDKASENYFSHNPELFLEKIYNHLLQI